MNIRKFKKEDENNAKTLYWLTYYNQVRETQVFAYPTRERIDEEDESIDLLVNVDFPLWEQEFVL